MKSLPCQVSETFLFPYGETPCSVNRRLVTKRKMHVMINAYNLLRIFLLLCKHAYSFGRCIYTILKFTLIIFKGLAALQDLFYLEYRNLIGSPIKNMFISHTRPSISPMGRQVGGFIFSKISQNVDIISDNGNKLQKTYFLTQIWFLPGTSNRF